MFGGWMLDIVNLKYIIISIIFIYQLLTFLVLVILLPLLIVSMFVLCTGPLKKKQSSPPSFSFINLCFLSLLVSIWPDKFYCHCHTQQTCAEFSCELVPKTMHLFVLDKATAHSYTLSFYLFILSPLSWLKMVA